MNTWPVRALGGLALLVALALLATAIAWWGWRVAGPAPVAIPVAPPADAAATILASGLFAVPGSAPEPVPAKDEGTLATGNARLLGVVAERDGRGYALFRLPSGPKLVAPGQEIAQGAQLVDVRPGTITIRDGGGERRIVLRGEPPPAKAAPVATAAPARGAARSAACSPPAGFKGSVLRLNAELFQGIIARPESWAALVAPQDGALSVRDDSGFVGMLAMKKGDRLATANGIALALPDDIVAAVLRPLAANQAVRVTGSRDGAPREWLLLNAGNCPA